MALLGRSGRSTAGDAQPVLLRIDLLDRSITIANDVITVLAQGAR
jgi:hypothetical protein